MLVALLVAMLSLIGPFLGLALPCFLWLSLCYLNAFWIAFALLALHCLCFASRGFPCAWPMLVALLCPHLLWLSRRWAYAFWVMLALLSVALPTPGLLFGLLLLFLLSLFIGVALVWLSVVFLSLADVVWIALALLFVGFLVPCLWTAFALLAVALSWFYLASSGFPRGWPSLVALLLPYFHWFSQCLANIFGIALALLSVAPLLLGIVNMISVSSGCLSGCLQFYCNVCSYSVFQICGFLVCVHAQVK